MEPGDRPAKDVSATTVRMVAVALLLVGLAFVQDPGYLVADTKFDLAVSPLDFLSRAFHLWDDSAAFGQVQNQAYGYLWPMGPFFAALHGIDVPGWAIQRLWQALVLCVAFVGAARLSRALGTRSDAAGIVAGVAFALSPRMLSVLGPISIEAWPSALLPWVLLPLVRGSIAGSPRRAAALSALAVAMVGGVNAAATFAVLPLGVVWILTRERGPRRTSLMLWWPLFTLLGTLWWLVPLFLLGAYSPPFLDFIETTTVTTFPTTVFDALRGTSNWVPYVSADSRAGNDLLVTGYLALNSGMVLLGGFVGLALRRTPHRLFLSLSVLTGLLMVTAGHHGTVEGLFSEGIRALLDGSLAPLRNVHKFDPVVRLPLVIGLAFLVDRLVAARARHARRTFEAQMSGMNRVAILGMVLVGLVGSMTPAFLGRIQPAEPVASVPQYWEEAAEWLGENGQDGTALAVPGSTFAEYLWGSPKDEPLQFLGQSPWAVRNTIPLSPPGNIRMLDEIEEHFAEGRGSRGLVSLLRRSGVQHLVVRNDLSPSNDVPVPAVVHQVLEQSPGLDRVASFGPQVGGGAHLTTDGVRTVVNGGWQGRYPAVEIFRVPGAADQHPSDRPTVVAGGPEDLADLEDLAVIGREPALLAPDVAGQRGLDPEQLPLVLTDGLRERERFFARVHDGYSATLTPGETPRGLNPNPDYLTPEQEEWLTRTRLEGARAISASSSMADSDAPGGTRRGELPFAAIDGSRATEWVSNPQRSGKAWWRIDLNRSQEIDRLTVVGGNQADENQALRVRTEHGVSEEFTAGPQERTSVDLPGGATRWIRIEDAGSSTRLLSLAEVAIPRVDVRRRQVLAATPASWGNPESIVLRADVDARRGCVTVRDEVRCVPGTARPSEEATGAARRFTLPDAASYEPDLVVRPRAGDALDDLMLRQQPLNITASSTGTPDPRSSALAAIDGDPATSWVAEVGDFRPTLRLNWLGPKSITGLALSRSEDAATRRPDELTLTWPGGRREVELDSRGRATFPAIRTSQLTIRVDEAEFATDLRFDGQSRQVAVGVQELRLSGLDFAPIAVSTQQTDLGCGTGPTVEVNGAELETSVVASAEELFSGSPLPARICRPGEAATGGGVAELDLRAGGNDVTVRGSEAFDFVSMVLRSEPRRDGAGVGTSSVERRSPVHRVLLPNSGAEVANLGQNHNVGWVGRQSGEELSPLVLNGWQQGWVVQGDEPVVATYAPDPVYRAGLVVGLVALLSLVATALLWPFRRRRHVELPPLCESELPTAAAFVIAGVSSVLVAGWLGGIVALAGAAAALRVQRRAPDAAPWVLGGCALVASSAYFFQPWADPGGWAGNEAWPHYLVLAPVAGLVVLAARGRRPRSFNRIAGASTNR